MSILKHIQNLVKIYQFVLKILGGGGGGEQNFGVNQGHNSSTNMLKRMCNNPKLDLVNMNAYIKFGENLSICSQNIEGKRNYDGGTEGRNG